MDEVFKARVELRVKDRTEAKDFLKQLVADATNIV